MRSVRFSAVLSRSAMRSSASIEISLFFAINGVIFIKLLPSDRRARMLGLPNRWTLALALSLVSVGVEMVFGYLTFYVVAFSVFDARRRATQLAAVGSLAALDLSAGLIFGPVLGWI